MNQHRNLEGKPPKEARLRLDVLADGTHSVTADLPGRIEITVDGEVSETTELTQAEHDQLVAGMARGQNIAKQAQAIVQNKHNGNSNG